MAVNAGVEMVTTVNMAKPITVIVMENLLEILSNVFININTDQHQYRVQLEFIIETNEVIYIEIFNTDSK